MSCPIICDYPTDLVPLNETRVCDVCGGYTWWASPRQKKNGRHWDCVKGVNSWQTSPEHHSRVITDVLAVFPGATVTLDWRAPVYPPDTYEGRDAGPCLRCRRRIRRYGMFAYLLCAECDARRKAS